MLIDLLFICIFTFSAIFHIFLNNFIFVTENLKVRQKYLDLFYFYFILFKREQHNVMRHVAILIFWGDILVSVKALKP